MRGVTCWRVQLSARPLVLRGLWQRGHTGWRSSYSSSASFYENKPGFTQNSPPQQLTSHYLLSLKNVKVLPYCHCRTVHSNTPEIPLYRQRRFTAEDNYPILRDIGLTTGRPLIETKSSYVAQGNRPSASSNNDAVDESEVRDIEVAFGEGYLLAEKSPETKSRGITSLKLLRLLLFIFVFYYINVKLWNLFGYGRIGSIRITFGSKVNNEEVTVTFADVIGMEEAKQELQHHVDFLKNPKKFEALGARLPKGVLLVGPPGVGKTLLARAVAGEAGVPFHHVSGSEFDELFVGTGAKRVRAIFENAKNDMPCIVFIDEIDSVGSKRTSSEMHPYANQTINQLLSEMDGFEKNEEIIVLGATNRRDNLDKALLRPGRFDAEVQVFAPDLKERRLILEHYMSKVKAADSVDLHKIAKRTTGCTGAELANLVNQAAIRATLEHQTEVTLEHLEWARDKILMGPAKKTRIDQEEVNKMTAYHEAGHTLVALYTPDSTPLNKVTILPRGLSLGHTSFLPEKEQYQLSRSQLMAEMDVAMGGHVAEELVFGSDNVTTGASSDFTRATKIATAMVKNYGMSEKVGMRYFDSEEVDMGIRFVEQNELGPNLAELVDLEIKRFLQESYDRAKHILKTHQTQHEAVAQALLKEETLDCSQVYELCGLKPRSDPKDSQSNS